MSNAFGNFCQARFQAMALHASTFWFKIEAYQHVYTIDIWQIYVEKIEKNRHNFLMCLTNQHERFRVCCLYMSLTPWGLWWGRTSVCPKRRAQFAISDPFYYSQHDDFPFSHLKFLIL
jgi:hypothetical protein